ncbi:MFS transporter [Salinibacterium hongtaonis]|uniref:MFS transporter n=1 Tax=Homoserinimonas hongtaonis TaxID=2079791 RepID=UPI000D393737|nr:MFS transporter [Salinibacterium hongtaonis]AWB89335.1 MFS transporter [Salinibacterium hongtaonis]
MNSRRSWIIWGAALFAYIVAVMQRSSLGVSAVEATDRFTISASALSTLAVVQLVVYAALQIPVGVLLDRFGSRVLIASGAVLMLTGQLLVAFSDHFALAVIGRMLVGAGDATTFISVLRLLPNWFGGKILPQVSQWTGNIGQLGQLLSVVPFAWLLHDFGWSAAFGAAALMSLVVFLLTLAIVHNAPDGAETAARPETWGGALRLARDALKRPGTQLGFWSHFTTQSPGTTFSLLWGFPFMVSALGYSTAQAAALLSVFLVVGLIAGPILGVLSARYPMRRSTMVIGIVLTTALTWAYVLIRNDPPPFWLVVLLIIVLGTGGPGSLISFDFARAFNPLRSHGSATGIVNVGGFVAAFVMMYLIGVSLDLASNLYSAAGNPVDLYSWETFRVAFASQFFVMAIGFVFLVLSRRKTRHRMKFDEGIEVAPLWVALSRAITRRRRE